MVKSVVFGGREVRVLIVFFLVIGFGVRDRLFCFFIWNIGIVSSGDFLGCWED